MDYSGLKTLTSSQICRLHFAKKYHFLGITQLPSFAKVKTQEENFDSFPVASGYNEMMRQDDCFLQRASRFLLSSREHGVFFCDAVKGTGVHKGMCTLAGPAVFIGVEGEI